MGLIKQLEPVPTRAFEQNPAVYLIPDILLSIDQQGVSISINPVINRQIEINMDYVRLLKTVQQIQRSGIFEKKPE